MAEQPLLVLPPPEIHSERSKLSSRGGKLRLPRAARQHERLAPRFAALQTQFEKRNVELRDDATGASPEEVIVLEIVGRVDDFSKAVAKVDELEWLGEVVESEIEPDDDFYTVNKEEERRENQLARRLFLIFSNQRALAQILSLWQTWQKGEKLPFGFAKWRDVFKRLLDVRRWSAQDRIAETGVLADWKQRLQSRDVVPCEIELWHRSNSNRAKLARDKVVKLVEGQSGAIKAECRIAEIAYHAIVAELPRAAVASLVSANDEIEIVCCEDIQVIRPVGQFPTEAAQGDDGPVPDDAIPRPEGEPVSALLDGLPLQNHRLLQGRLTIDDPDDFGEDYPANKRCHGTSMASVIVHGDLSRPGPVGRPIYVRPILRPNEWPGNEVVPDEHLIVDLIHRAIHRLKVGDAGESPAAPDVCIINLSIGDPTRPFHTTLSPLARLLDWLAWRHNLLFIVSAGNHAKPIRIETPKSEFLALNDQDRRDRILKAVAAQGRLRRLLSPSEAVNALTVGAMHNDLSDNEIPVEHVDPIGPCSLPNPMSALGLGYRRAVKPELLANGGRSALEIEEDGKEAILLNLYGGPLPPGVLTAAPCSHPGDLARATYTRGTSVACAAVSHSATRLYDVVEDLRATHEREIDKVPRALWLKALLVHAAKWQEGHEILENTLKNERNSRKFREYSARFLGYGGFDPQRVAACSENRATALAAGAVSADEKRTHRFPLPPSLASVREWKRLTITLAWFTPVNPLHQGWRRADLWFEAGAEALKVKRTGADHQAVRRGTLQHEIYEGEQAAVFVDGDSAEIDVNCKAGAGGLDEPVPYALAGTLEVRDGVSIPIYEEVKDRIRQRVRIKPSA